MKNMSRGFTVSGVLSFMLDKLDVLHGIVKGLDMRRKKMDKVKRQLFAVKSLLLILSRFDFDRK